MPPNVSKVYVSLKVTSLTNPTLYGPGKLSVAENIELNNAAASQKILTTSQPLFIESNKQLNITSLSGYDTIVQSGKDVRSTANAHTYINTASVSGNCEIRAGATSGTSLVDGSLVKIGDVAASNITLNSSNTITSTSVGQTLIQSSSTTGVVSVQGGQNLGGLANIDGFQTSVGISRARQVAIGNSSVTNVDVDGVAIRLGTSGSTTTIPGSLVVQGTTSTIDTVNLTVKDNLICLNELPNAMGKDSGVLMTRYSTDVATGTADATDTISSAVSVGAVTIPLTTGGAYTGYYLKIGTDVVRITAVSGNNMTVSPALASGYAISTAVSLYKKASVATIWDESSRQFRLCYTNALSTSANIADPALGATGEYADLHLKNLYIEGTVQGGGLSSSTIAVPDNATSSAGYVQLPNLATRGCYQIFIQSSSSTGSAAIVFVSKTQASDTSAALFSLVQSAAASGSDEQVAVQWLANEAPSLYHSTTKTGGTGATIDYTYKVVTA